MGGWDTDVLDENLAIILDPESPIGKPNPTYEEAIQAFETRQKQAAAAAAAPAKKEGGDKGKKKKKGGKKAESDDDDLDAVLLEFKDKKDEATTPATEQLDEPSEKADGPDAKAAAN